MALSARSFRRKSLPLDLLRLEDRTVPTVSFPDYTVGRYPFGWLGGEDVNRQDLPPTKFVSNPSGFLTGPQPGDRNSLALQNLGEFAGLLNIPAADAQAKFVTVTDSYADQVGTMQHVYLRQTVNGLPVLNSSVGVHYAADGRLLTINGGFFGGLAALDAGSVPAPTLTAVEAVVEGAYQVGFDVTKMPKADGGAAGADRTTTVSSPQASDRPITAQLAYVFSAAAGTAREVWHFNLDAPDGSAWHDIGVDVQTGEVLFSVNWQDNYATYRALPFPNESPTDPSVGGQQQYEVNPFDPTWSPYGWQDTDGKAGAEYTDTRGNNVSAQLNLSGTTSPSPSITTPTSGGNRPDGGAGLVFDTPFVVGASPTTGPQRLALVTNLFYANNMLHDIHAAYGFTEAAGNFQYTNYSGQGLGGDNVNAEAQDGSGVNNANFATPPDGTSGRMRMYLFTGNPQTDSDYDNGVMMHEYGHGVTNRLTGGPSNSNALSAQQSGGMGEGWSDFFALMFTQVPTDRATDRYPLGTWVLNQNPLTGPGIRRHPYSFDLTIDPINYSDYAASTEVHDAGEIWASTLWDLNWLLINKYGFDPDLTTGYAPGGGPASAGNKLTLQLVEDALKLQPANPSFTDARDAILQADVNLTGGANQREIWTAFARRQLGFGSSTPNSGSSTIVTSTALPPAAANPGIVGVTPPGTSAVPPGSIQLTFSEAMDPTSFDQSDIVSFTGPGGVDLSGSVTGITWSAGNTVATVTFTPPAQAQGRYALTVGPNILSADNGSKLDQNLDGTAGGTGDTFTAYFAYDQTPLTITGWTPVTSSVATVGLSAVDVKFSEPVDPATVSASDLQISEQGTVTGASVLGDGSTVRFSVAGLTTGRVYLQVKQAAVTDRYGFSNLTGHSNFLIPGTITTKALPVPLAAQGPVGSLSYQSSSAGSGTLTSPVDLYQFTVSLDAGQTLGVSVDGVTTLAPQLAVVGPSGAIVGTAPSAGAGVGVRLDGLTVGATGTYTIQVSSGGGTTGSFSVRAYLNTRAEAESVGGAANNTAATAQPLAGFYQTAGGGLVTTVSGQTDGVAPNVLAEVEPNDTTATANAAGGNFTATPTGPVYMMPLAGSIGSAGDQDYYNVGTLDAGDVLTVDTYGTTSAPGLGLTLDDTVLDLYDASGTLVAEDDDGGPDGLSSQLFRVSIPATGKYYVVVRAFGSNTGTYQAGVYLTNKSGTTAPTTGGAFPADTEPNDSTTAAVNASTAWRQAGYINPISGTLSTTSDADTFQFTLTAGDLFTPTVDGVPSSVYNAVSIMNAAGVVLYEDAGYGNGGNAYVTTLPALLIPTTGTYYVQVTSSGGAGPYTLTADLASTTPPGPPAPAGSPIYDFYSVSLAAGDVLSAGLKQSLGTSAAFDIVDPSGAVVASSTVGTVGSSYSAATNGYVAPSAGTYTVRVRDTGINTYTLTTATNALLDFEPNGSLAQAQSAGAAHVAVGGITAADAGDFYTFTAAAGQVLVLRTTTPGDGPGEFVNTLDPQLKLFDPTGVLVAADDNSAPDGRNARITYTALTAGTYTVQVSRVGTTTGEYVVSLPGAVNQPPTDVSAGGPYNPPEGSGVTLTAAAFDPDGDPLTYSWDLNGDGVFGDRTGQTVVLTASDMAALGLADGPALRSIRVQVSDGLATVTSGPSDLNVVNVAPTATPVAPTVAEGSAGTFQLTNPLDPSAADTAAGFKYAFDFTNDGTFDAGDGTYAGGVGPSVPVPASYFPDGPATFTARARVIDKDGGYTDYTFTVTVTNVAPTATVVNGGAVNEGSTGLVRFTAQADPSADDRTNGFHYAYDFNNDGTFDVGDGTYAGSGIAVSQTVPASYLADGPAVRTVHVRIIDKDDGHSDYTTDISVRNVAPTARFATGGAVNEGANGKVSFTLPVDPSPTDVSAGFRYAYDFNNDGTFDLGDGTYAGGAGVGASVPVPTSYLPDNGTYTIRGRILDKDGGFTDYTTVLTVNNLPPTAASVTNAGPVAEGGTTTVTVNGGTDPSPVDAASLHYAFDFDGDGVFDQGDGTYAGSGTNPVGTAAGVYFPDGPGVRTVRARVIDKDGGFTDYTTDVTVTNVAPTATVAPVAPVAEGGGTSVTLTGAFDPSPVDTATGFRYAVKLAGSSAWLSGDGTYAGSKSAPTAVLSAGLFPDGPGTVGLIARILDKDGGFTDYPVSVTVQNVAPTATLTNGGAVLEGRTGTVSFINPVDPSAADVAAGFQYAYDFDNDGKFDLGDGTYAGGVGATATVPAGYFADGGTGVTRTVRARILDKDGGYTDYTTTLSVLNAPPTGIPGNGGPVAEGQAGSVSLSAATDPSAADVAAGLHFAYDFNGDGVFDLGDGTYAGSGTAATATVPAADLDDGPSARQVRIRVIDKDGGYTQYTTTIPVTNVAPTATFFNPGPVNEGSAGSVLFAGPADPSNADTAAGFRYAYDFGNDGTFDVGGTDYASAVTAASQPVPASFLADGPGSVVVRGRIYDKDGGFTEYTTTLTVLDVPPTAVLGYTPTGPDGKSVLEGQSAAIAFSGAKDASAADTAAGFKYAFDYNNDGTFDSGDGTYAGGVGPVGSVPAALLDNGPSTRTVRARVIDKDGGFTDYTLPLTVANVAPTATPVIGPAVTIGTASTLGLTGVSDPSAGDTAAGFTYTFDFGDGTLVTGGSPTASHVYSKPGTFAVGLRVSDRDGGNTSKSGTLTVSNVAPTATFASAGPVPEGGTATVRFTDPQHPSPATVASGFRYAYDLNNDGTFELGDGTYAGSVANPEVPLPAALTANAGTVTVRARIIEVNGLSTDYTTTVTVTDVAPTATPVDPVPPPGGFVVGQSVTIGLSQPTDPSASDRAGLTYSFDFTGDGTFDVTGSKSLTATYAYPTAGTFTAVARVTDPKGASTDYQIPVTIGTPAPTLPPPTPTGYAVGSDAGGGTARLFTDSGAEVYNGQPFGADYTGGVRVATGDVNGDGTPDLIAGTGPGSVTRVVVIDGRTRAIILDVQPFEDQFTGGLFVSAGDVDGDGKAEIAVSPDVGGGPVVAVYGMGGQKVRFFGIEDPNFRGGARTAMADVNGDGKSDLLVAAGIGGGPRLAGFDGPSLGSGQPVKLFADFFVFEDTLRNGVYVAAGDLNKDGKADVVVGGGPGGGPRVLALDGRDLLANRQTTVANFFAGDPDNRDGVRVTVKDLDLDGTDDVLVGSATPTASGFRVRGYTATDLLQGNVSAKYLLDPFPGELGGVFVG